MFWLARNKDNTLVLFQSKPVLDDDLNWNETLNEDCMFIPEYLYPEITFYDSPQRVELKLVKKE